MPCPAAVGRAVLRAAPLFALFAAACERAPTPPPTPAPAAAPRAAGPVSYGRDILPVLSNRCFRCHGPDAAAREGKLRLDVRDDAVALREGGRRAFSPGDPETSEALRRLRHPDPQKRMPPVASKMPELTADEEAVLRRWILDGAVYEPHWAFAPPRRSPSPPTTAADVRDPLDAFVYDELERRGIAASPPADAETWCRRVFLELTGLPPTPEETAAFLADVQPGAAERLVDRLLSAEPYATRYAERRAAAWLDLARYADTIGLHTDAGRNVWPYRDRILRAFRDDQPYDVFATEQLAGDLLPEATVDQKVASGFNRLHVQSDEGGAIPEEYLAEYAAERASTAGAVFLGLTFACARCHDHKYDPLSQDDFYRLFAYFNSVDEPGLYSQEPDPLRSHEPYLAVPTAEQTRELAALRERRAAAAAERDRGAPEDDARRAAWETELVRAAGLRDAPATLLAATSEGGADVLREPDGFVFFGGKNPDVDVHTLTFRAAADGARLLILEAAEDPRLPQGRVGRAENGNAVLTSVSVERAARGADSRPAKVPLVWAWSDVAQANDDFAVVNALSPEADGWAVDAHGRGGPRVAAFLAAEPFAAAGEEFTVRLAYRSRYARHVLGRVRARFAALDEKGAARLPVAYGGWFRAGPFPATDDSYAAAYGPEEGSTLDLARNFGHGNRRWEFVAGFVDGRNHDLADNANVTYVGRRAFAAASRPAAAKIGSDDGLRVFVDGRDVHTHRIDRGLNLPHDDVAWTLFPGGHAVVLKIVNTGGEGGFAFRAKEEPDDLTGPLVAAFFPPDARHPGLARDYAAAWRLKFSPDARRLADELADLDRRIAAIERAVPRTPVMKELPASRPAYVLKRGQYDQPDLGRGVARGAPAALGRMPENAPADRRGLAAWLTSPDHPLFARVVVNRVWESCFGTGLVRTSEDFGLQGERPSHPELLDTLAVDFRDDGYSLKRLYRRIVLSATYRRASTHRPDLRDVDPDQRLLASFPRRRLSAEQIRDQALYVGGLLVETFGGPPVRPYQPPGLWEEVSMPVSNTRVYRRGEGADLYRRSLYTFWKRASPPPTMLAFDAPTRESCQVRRVATNTPLQALVLWNDETFVEAARALAARTLAESGDDAARLARIFARCAGRAPDATESAALAGALATFRARYAAAPQDAEALLKVGAASRPAEIAAPELAAWTMVASVALNADAATSRS
jgi:hypothetical protein